MKRKGWILFFLLLALVALAVLASGLSDLHFEPGKPASGIEIPKIVEPSLIAEKIASTPLWKIILIWTIFVINLILFFYLLPPEVRKRILRQVIRFALTVAVVIFALRNQVFQLPSLISGEPVQGNLPPQAGPSGNDVPVFQPPVLSPWMIYLISIGVTLALLVLTWAAYHFWTRFRAGRQFSSLDVIAKVARSSLDDLAAGHDWGDVVIESYVRMSEAVSTQRGLARTDAMTPREFAMRLERAGLPANAVSRLTRLFESVRYGARPSTQADVNEAAACLSLILQACGVTQ